MIIETASPVHINYDRRSCPSLSIIHFLQFRPKRRLLKAWLRFTSEKPAHMQDAVRVQKAERKRRHEQVRPFPGTYETPG